MSQSISVLFLCFLAGSSAFGQRQVTGSVEDFDTGELLPFANVFVDGSTIGVSTDQNGKFILVLPTEMKVVLVVAYVGYQTEQMIVAAELGDKIQLRVRLKVNKEVLEEVSVTAKRDRDWQKNFKEFEKAFIGSGTNAQKTTIKNPGMIDLGREKGRLVASSEEPIKIENRALGYEVTYFIRDFSATRSDYRISGFAKFQELQTLFLDERNSWTLNRQRSFNGSLTHFLRSLIAGTHEQEGFKIYYTHYGLDSESPVIHFNPNSAFVEAASPKIVRLDSHHFQIEFQGKLEIHYLREASTQVAYRNIAYQVSVLEALNGRLVCFDNGLVPDITNYQLLGDMATYRISDLLPTDYLPPNLPIFSGRVMDRSSQKPIPNAEVFINRSTFRAQTDWAGNFQIVNVDSGYYQLIINAPGYEMLQVEDFIGNNSKREKIFEMTRAPRLGGRLSAKNKMYQRIEKHVETSVGGRTLTDSIFVVTRGTFGLFKSGESVRVVFEKPVEIQNRKTGYTILTYPSNFLVGETTQNFDRYWFLSNLSQDINRRQYFENNRLQSYLGSTQHFLKSVAEGKLNTNGFQLIDEFDPHNLSKRDSHGYISLDVKKLKSVQFTNITGLVDFTRAPHTQIKPVASLGDRLKINMRGLAWPSDQFSIGEVNQVSSLPINYTSPYSYQYLYDFKLMQEDPHILTDKLIYYPGERIHVSVPIKYSFPQYRDSLSRVLYLDLVDTTGRVLDQVRTLITNGQANGTFKLSHSIAVGAYRVRAYTSWMLNFREPSTATIWITSSGLSTADSSRPLVKNEFLRISLSKEVFLPREEIDIQVQLPSGRNGKIHVISVVDLGLVSDQPLVEMDEISPPFKPWTYPLEWFLRYQGVMKATDIKSIMAYNQADSTYAYVRLDGSNGIEFWTNDFFDSARFTFSGVDKRKLVSVPVQLATVTPPVCQPWQPTTQLTLHPSKTVAMYPTYIPKDNIMLQEVTVKARRIVEPVKPKSKSAKADPNSNVFVLTSDQFANAPNLALAAAARVPGLQVIWNGTEYPDIKFTRDLFSSNDVIQQGPLVVINDVSMPGYQAGEALASLDATTVERVEFMSQINPTYGLLASQGVILIYTKGFGNGETVTNQITMQSQFLIGFQRPLNLLGPDYSRQDRNLGDPDFRSTLYWNPEVVTDEYGKASISFYAGDAQRRFKVVVWGSDDRGQLVKTEDVFEIKR